MEETERVIEIINKQTGYDKITVGCWLEVYKTDGCALCDIGWCRKQIICANLEGRYHE